MREEIVAADPRKVIVRVKDLRVRYIPVVTPLDLWRNDMSIENSPHVELMRIFYGHGFNWDMIKESRYYAEREHRGAIGMERWTTEKIREHIKARYRVFKSIRKHGYDKTMSKKNPVKVLGHPFWATRFGCEIPYVFDHYEIWNGAGRCSAAFVLGIDL